MEKTPNKYEIVSRGKKKDKSFTGSRIGIAIALLFILPMMADYQMAVIMFVPTSFAFVAFLLIIFSFIRMNRTQIVSVDNENVSFEGVGETLSKRITVPKEQIQKVILGRMFGVANSGNLVTLTVQVRDRFPGFKIRLAPFLHPDEKAKIYKELLVFLDSHGVDFERISTYNSNETEKDDTIIRWFRNEQ